MRRLHTLTLPTLLMTMLASTSAQAAPWLESDAFSALDDASGGSCKVDAADLDGDGFIDLVFANTGGTLNGAMASAQQQQAFKNDGAGNFTDISAEVFNGVEYTGRAVKIRDIDYDGDNDIILGTTWIEQSQLFINDNGNFVNETDPALPMRKASVGDLEVGDVDDDGDLDLVLTNWGENAREDDVVNAGSAGGVTLLWSQDGDPEYGDKGSAIFVDVTDPQMPVLDMRMAWELEFIDMNNDYQIDILTVCKWCTPDKSLFLFMNDKDNPGNFTNTPISNVQSGNQLNADGNDVEVIDLNGDKFLDVVVLHDGFNARNRVITNDGAGGFVPADMFWPALENPKSQDSMLGFYDYDSDSDPDLVIGAFKTADVMNASPDRLMINEVGVFKQYDTGMPGPLKNQALEEMSKASAGSCAIVLADLTGDHKLDVAMGSYDNAFEKYVYFATDEVAPDTAAPIIGIFQTAEDIGGFQYPGKETVRLRVHDNKSPLMLHDFRDDGLPYIEYWTTDPNPDPDANPGTITHGQWYGEYLWRITFEVPVSVQAWYRYCAIDAAGNRACTGVLDTTPTCFGPTCDDTDTDTETDTTITDTTITDTTVSDTIDTDPTLTDPTDGTITDTLPSNNTDSDSDTNGPQPTIDSFDVDSVTESNTISDSDSLSDTDSDSNDTTALDDDGCGCNTDDGPSGALASLALLGLLGIRRRRR
jgi:MYXO-CTERM domain-containing protein